MSTTKEVRGKLIFVAVMSILAGLFYIIADYLPSYRLKNNHRYTIATITSIEFPAEGGPSVYIKYSVKNNQYKGSFGINWDNQKKYKMGSRIYIYFYPDNPDNAQIVHDKYVRDTIKFIPQEGWEKIPD